MTHLFQHSKESPFHISVGVVLINEQGEVCVHKHTRENTPAESLDVLGSLSEVYILMRESLENGETLEDAVHRGIQEEFGAEGDILRYLGAIRCDIQPKTYAFEKVTLYFLMQLTALHERPQEDEEAHSVLEWHTPEFLIEKMREQGTATGRGDLDESKIIEAYVTYR